MTSKLSRFFGGSDVVVRTPPVYAPRMAVSELVAEFVAGQMPSIIPKPQELDWWDWTVLLLDAASEVEHALLVQYLYAAYSLSLSGPYAGQHVPPNAPQLVQGWRTAILRIARQEMAHLLTVQNCHHVVGASPTFDRQPLPSDSPVYPFPFMLEPLSHASLAKYVVAEMPASAAPNIMDTIAEAANASGRPVNPVGPLYMTLVDIFQDPARLKDSDLLLGTADSIQAQPDDWGGSDAMIIRVIDSREHASSALRQIGEQGEGPWEATPSTKPSHFETFLEVYRAYPGAAGGGEPPWIPTKAVPTGPTTDPKGPAAGVIEDRVALLWAKFSNVRYRILLTSIAHALVIAAPFDVTGKRTAKGMVIDLSFDEIVGHHTEEDG